ncbi:hypothetical protein OIDMADRAFT_46157 [Oidiodendron maius Zn]|uniref:ASST-domain-containing protein n=1 Tax=Oidiodendron maius (strain Zn) TaxID=913774 RepID=A0A0C3C4G4_OIDMZ|nr:hypothetical protein OIDMADRAFT_46157 [Oidiodendron maius Zn]
MLSIQVLVSAQAPPFFHAPYLFLQGIFLEIDIRTGDVLFEWRSLGHVPLNETYWLLGSNPEVGFGNATDQSWDYFHLNSIDKDHDGNYIVSSRHCSTVFKISKHDGSIMWRLEHKTTTILSIFDNGSNGYSTTSLYSSGMVMAVDTRTMTCTLLNQYYNHRTPKVTTAEGSTQVLSNTNVFIGWGSQPEISEFTESSQCIMHGAFGALNVASSYRAFKISEWVGRPDSTPAVWSYANSSELPTTFYISWNGATQLAHWRFFGGNSTSCPLSLIGGAFYSYGYAEAIDKQGEKLGISPIIRTFVPYPAS